MINLNKIMPVEMILPRIYVITGLTGTGKTSLGSAMLKRDYLKYGRQRFQESLALINTLRNNGYPNLRLDANLYFCSNFLLLDKKQDIKAWDVDFTKLGLPNEKYKVQNLPYGAVCFFPDVDQVLNSHDFKNGINEYLRGFLKYHRHNNLTLILDMQDFELLAKDIRRLVHFVIYVDRKQDFTFFKKLYKTKWKLRILDMGYLNLIKSLELANIEVSERSYMKYGKFTFYGNIHNYYDSESGLPYFLNGVDHYDYVQNDHFDLTKASIEDFVERHPYSPPDGFKRGNKIDIKNLPNETKKKIDNLTKQFKDYLYENLRRGESEEDD